MPWDAEAPWSLKDALQVARELEELDVYWMEEPLHRGDYDGMAELRRATDIRIAGGEMTRELHEFRTLVQRGSLDVQLARSEEHTSEIQSLMRISYAVFCLKKKKHINNQAAST